MLGVVVGVVVVVLLWCLKFLLFGQDELSEKSILEIKKDELDAASKQWKSRVEKSDAEKFSVAGRMEKNREESNLPINIPAMEKNKKTPQAKRFKGKEGTEFLIYRRRNHSKKNVARNANKWRKVDGKLITNAIIEKWCFELLSI
jgi:hypothetical protein